MPIAKCRMPNEMQLGARDSSFGIRHSAFGNRHFHRSGNSIGRVPVFQTGDAGSNPAHCILEI